MREGWRATVAFAVAIVVLLVGLAIVPRIIISASNPRQQPHLQSVSDNVLALSDVELRPPPPEPSGCDRLTAAVSVVGYGRSAIEAFCPPDIDKTVAEREAVALTRTGPDESIHADCTAIRAGVSHRDCWVVVFPASEYAFLAPLPSVSGPQPKRLVFIDAKTGRQLASVVVVPRPVPLPAPIPGT